MDAVRGAAGAADESIRLHQQRLQHGEAYNTESQQFNDVCQKAAVYSGILGAAVTTSIFALQAVLPQHPWRLVGLATVAPTGVALGLSVFSAIRTDRQFYDRERSREEWELQNYPEGELAEMVEVYVGKGLTREKAIEFVGLLAKDERAFVDLMMVEELGYSSRGMPGFGDAVRVALSSTFAFGLAAGVPLLLRKPSLGKATLAAVVVTESVLHAKLMLGAYADMTDYLRTLATNAAHISVIAGISAGLGKAIVALSSTASARWLL